MNTFRSELELKTKSRSDADASFLDLDIKTAKRKISLILYDKRDSFPFSVVGMPYLRINMHSRIFYTSIGAEIQLS